MLSDRVRGSARATDPGLRRDDSVDVARSTRAGMTAWWADQGPRSLWRCALLAFAVLLAVPSLARAEYPKMGDVIFANGTDWPTLHVGGANYYWYDLDPVCLREDYGLLANYHVPGVRAIAQQQLASMYAEGMRTMAIGVMFQDGPNSGTLIDARDPAQISQAADNLARLLTDIATSGYPRVLFRFFPQGSMSPPAARSNDFDPSTLGLYKDVIAAMRPELVATRQVYGLDYLIDLGVEGAAPDEGSGLCAWKHGGEPWHCPEYEDWSNATRDLWAWYVSEYGSADTIGFSFLAGTGEMRNRVRHMKYIYAGTYPAQLAIDIYGEPGHTPADQLVYFMGLVHGYAQDFGFQIDSFIVAETFNNDPWVAAGVSSVIAASGDTVAYLTEWPLDRGSVCEHVSEAPPYAFDIYRMYGF